MILVVDNYDSFTYNLVQGLGVLGEELVVHRNDVPISEIAALRPEAIVLSPGPGAPADAGCCIELIQELGAEIPILGVCLGHQAIAEAFGGRVVPAPEVVHGKTAAVTHDDEGLFAGVGNPFQAARYHSLVVDPDGLPDSLSVTARTGDIVMGMKHVSSPILGVQFHPESIATPSGGQVLSNFVAFARQNRRSSR
ncbi:MAG: anthranilate/aminodeoxychorismate synthase component II [Acidobacteria bacterium]|nr:anthranilate/aminodeoxychorismate synthase component II [Acidobacteriota bacterium]